MFRQTAHVYDLIYEATGKDYAAEAAVVVTQERNPGARTLPPATIPAHAARGRATRRRTAVPGHHLADRLGDPATGNGGGVERSEAHVERAR